VLPLPTFVPRRYRPGSLANWSGHLAFANDLIVQHRPSLLVELGTHYGESYFGMCQSVLENGLDCVCYAVDHWHGEEHAGFYGEEVFTEVEEYNRHSYKGFSYLLRSGFDDALPQFTDESIGLLHIDGLHTYEAISHDFRSWLPKVKPGGIVLLHDVMVRHANFGIWKLWDELQLEFPDTFTFNHSWGLGVLRKPDGGSKLPEFLDFLFHSSAEANEQIRRHYVLYAGYLETLFASTKHPKAPVAAPGAGAFVTKSGPLLMQLFLPTPGGYSEAASFVQEFDAGDKTTVAFNLPAGVSGCLRIDPVDRPCVFEIASISLLETDSRNIIWSADAPAAIRSLALSDSASFLPQAESCFVVSFGNDPNLSLPPLDHKGPLLLEVSIRVEPDFQRLSKALAIAKRAAESNEAPVRFDAAKPGITIQVYPFNPAGYLESEMQSQTVELGRWTTVTFDLEAGSCAGPIRLDPADAPCLVEIGALRILDAATGGSLLDLRGREQLKSLNLTDELVPVSLDERYILFCYGDDPKLEIIQPSSFSGSARLELSILFGPSFKALAATLSEVVAERDKMARDLKIVKRQLSAAQSSRLLLAAEWSRLATEKNSAQGDIAAGQNIREDLAAQHQAAEAALLQKQQDLAAQYQAAEAALLQKQQDLAAQHHAVEAALLRKQQDLAAQHQAAEAASSRRIALLEEKQRKTAAELAREQAELASQRAIIDSVVRSLSWRLTQPLRATMMLLRGRPRGAKHV
jgi:hypothetical protein